MRIYLCCPECGGTDWQFREEDADFRCLDCGATVYPEDMGAVTSEGDELY